MHLVNKKEKNKLRKIRRNAPIFPSTKHNNFSIFHSSLSIGTGLTIGILTLYCVSYLFHRQTFLKIRGLLHYQEVDSTSTDQPKNKYSVWRSSDDEIFNIYFMYTTCQTMCQAREEGKKNKTQFCPQSTYMPFMGKEASHSYFISCEVTV